MSIFGKILKATIKAATLPVDIAKDVVTLGGVLTDEKESYTKQGVDDIIGALEELGDEIDDL